jgi:hypothetical protein
VSNTGFSQMLMPISALTFYAEEDEQRAASYWSYLQSCNGDSILELRSRSDWVLCWLDRYVPGGKEIAEGFRDGVKCERGYAALLDSLSKQVLAQCLEHAFALRQQPQETLSQKLEELLESLLSMPHGGDAYSPVRKLTVRLALGEPISMITLCRTLEASLLNAKALLTLSDESLENSVANMLVELTAWGNAPNNNLPWWRRFSADGIVERLSTGEHPAELPGF